MGAVVVNFFAPWCPWCQRLEPTWELVTQEVHKRYPEDDGRLRFAKVPRELCASPASAPALLLLWPGLYLCAGCRQDQSMACMGRVTHDTDVNS